MNVKYMFLTFLVSVTVMICDSFMIEGRFKFCNIKDSPSLDTNVECPKPATKSDEPPIVAKWNLFSGEARWLQVGGRK